MNLKTSRPTLISVRACRSAPTSNNNWKDTQQTEIEATTSPPPHELEAAIVSFLPPAAYTAIVRGVNDTTGVALVEACALE